MRRAKSPLFCHLFLFLPTSRFETDPIFLLASLPFVLLKMYGDRQEEEYPHSGFCPDCPEWAPEAQQDVLPLGRCPGLEDDGEEAEP